MDFTKLPGLSWMQNGQAALSGSLWTLFKKLDSIFLSWATEWSAAEFNVPAFISATEMKKLDYFRSVPHLITFPVTLENAGTSLQLFADRTHDPHIELTQTNPVQDILTPAACYHFYILYQDQTVGEPLYLTTLANCFRKETHYFPLQRHWSFSMREIVCIGSIDDVQSFLS